MVEFMVVFRCPTNVQCCANFRIGELPTGMQKLALAAFLISSFVAAGEDAPEFPLRSKYLERLSIFTPRHLDRCALVFVINTLKKTPPERLNSAKFSTDLISLSEDIVKHRGEVVEIEGTPFGFHKTKVQKCDPEIEQFWIGQVIEDNGSICTLITLKEPIADKRLKARGVVVQRFSYVTRFSDVIHIDSWVVTLLVVATETEFGEPAKELPKSTLGNMPRENTDDSLVENRPIPQIWLDLKNGKHRGQFDGNDYEIVDGPNGDKELVEAIEKTMKSKMNEDAIKKSADGTVPIPINLRVKEDVLMRTVERVVNDINKLGLNDIRYFLAKPTKSTK